MSGENAAASLILGVRSDAALAEVKALAGAFKTLREQVALLKTTQIGVSDLGVSKAVGEVDKAITRGTITWGQTLSNGVRANFKSAIATGFDDASVVLQSKFGELGATNLAQLLKNAEEQKALLKEQAQQVYIYQKEGATAYRQTLAQQRRDLEEHVARTKTLQAEQAQQVYIYQQRGSEAYKALQAEQAQQVYIYQQRGTAEYKRRLLEQEQQYKEHMLRQAETARQGQAAIAAAEADARFASLAPAAKFSRASQASAALGAGMENEAAIGKYGRAAVLAAGNLDTFKASLIATAKANGDLNTVAKLTEQSMVRLHSHIPGWRQAWGDMHAGIRGVSGSLGLLWTTYGAILPLLAGASIGAGLKSIVTVGKELEYHLRYVQELSGGATVSLSKFLETTKGTLNSPIEAAKGMRALAQAGLGVSEAFTALPSVLNLATVGELSVAEAALTATGVMHTFSLTVGDMAHIGDVFAKMAAVSNTSVSEMAQSMKYASSAASMYGVTLDETAAALAVMASRNITGTMAGTAFRNMLKELEAPMGRAAKIMHQYGLEVFDAQGKFVGIGEAMRRVKAITDTMTQEGAANFLQAVFGERGGRAVDAMLANLDTYNTRLKEAKEASQGLGFVNDVVMGLADTTEGQFKRMGNNIQSTFGEVFKSTNGAIFNLTQKLADFVGSDAFRGALQGLANTVIRFTDVVIENKGAIEALFIAYAGFKVLNTVTTLALAAAGAMKALKEANLEAALASRVAATASAEAAAGGLTATVGALGRVGAVLGAVSSGVGLAVAVGTGLLAAWSLYTSSVKKASDAGDDFDSRSNRLVDALHRQQQALDDQIATLRERNKLFLEGKSPEDAPTISNYARQRSQAQTDLTELRKQLAAAEAVAAEKNKAYQRSSFTLEKVSDPYNNPELINLRKQVVAAESRMRYLQASETQALASAAEARRLATVEQQHNEAASMLKQQEALLNAKKVKSPFLDFTAATLRTTAEADLGALLERNKKELEKHLGTFTAASTGGRNEPLSNALAEDNASYQLKRDTLDLEQKRLDLRNQMGQVGARELVNAKADLKIREAQLEVDRRTAELETVRRQGAKPHQITAAAGKLDLANQQLEAATQTKPLLLAKAVKDQETEIDNMLRQIAGKRMNHAEEWAAEWSAKWESVLQSAVRDAKLFGDNGLVARLQELKKAGDASAMGQDAQDSAKATLAELSQKIADIQMVADQGSLLDRLFADQQISDLISTKLPELKQQIETVKSVGTDKSRLDAAGDLKELSKLEASSHKFGKKVSADFETLLTESFKTSFDKGESFAKTFGSNLKSYFRDLLLQVSVKMTVGTVMNGLGSVLNIPGMGSSGGGSAGGVGSTLTNWALNQLGIHAAGSSVPTDFFAGQLGSPLGDAGSSGGLLSSIASFFGFAKGGSFSPHYFANGGTFTNQIFSNPTLFKFASGGGFNLGVMGEKRAEAVMPLERDSTGSLGVRANITGGNSAPVNISVVINHNGDATASGNDTRMVSAVKRLMVDFVKTEKRVGGLLYSPVTR